MLAASFHRHETKRTEKAIVTILYIIPEKESGWGYMRDFSFMCICSSFSQIICRKPCPKYLQLKFYAQTSNHNYFLEEFYRSGIFGVNSMSIAMAFRYCQNCLPLQCHQQGANTYVPSTALHGWQLPFIYLITHEGKHCWLHL